MNTPELKPVSFETRHGSTTIKSTVNPLPKDTADTFSARVEKHRGEVKHRAEQLEPVRKRVVAERPIRKRSWSTDDEPDFDMDEGYGHGV